MYVHASVLLEDRSDSRPWSTDKFPTHRPLPGPTASCSSPSHVPLCTPSPPTLFQTFPRAFASAPKLSSGFSHPKSLVEQGGDLMPAFGWWWREEVAGMQYTVQRGLRCSHSAPPCCRGNLTTRGEDGVAPLPHQAQELGQLSAHSENTWHMSAVTRTAVLSPPHEAPSPQVSRDSARSRNSV